MPFRFEQVESLCRLTDDYNGKYPATAEQKQVIRERVERIVKANELLAGAEFEALSDTTATALLMLLISDVP